MPFDLNRELEKLRGIEGEYSNDKDDSGGETKWGWTLAAARAFGYMGPMKDLPWERAKEMYKERFWFQPRFDLVSAISNPIAAELLDTGINMGQATGVKFMQRALNVLNRGGTDFPDIAVDGGIGKMTLAALSAFLKFRKAEGEVVLLRMMNAQQGVKYIELAEARPKDEKFVFGWQYNRVAI